MTGDSRLRWLPAAVVAAGIFASCIGSDQKEQTESYFDPIPYVERPASQQTASVPPAVPAVANDVNARLVVLMREQNRQVREMVGQLRMISGTSSTLNTRLARADSLQSILASDDTLSTDLLLDVLREQNSQLAAAVAAARTVVNDRQQFIAAPASQTQMRPHLPLQRRGGSLALALKSYREGRYQRATQMLEGLLAGEASQPDKDAYRFWLGVSHFQLRNLGEAVQAFTGVLKSPTRYRRESAFFMLGQCYEQLGAPTLARTAFERGMQASPTGSLRPYMEKKLAHLQ